jgi:polyhydroxyalkanoate synthesis regulator phasin
MKEKLTGDDFLEDLIKKSKEKLSKLDKKIKKQINKNSKYYEVKKGKNKGKLNKK